LQWNIAWNSDAWYDGLVNKSRLSREKGEKRMNTYCGKNCEECTYKAELSCPGCQIGPGRVLNGECKLARCCREKGHETCETCALKRNCGTWLDKGSIPKQRIERISEEEEKQALIARKAPFLGKWLWILFWLIVPQVILNFMTGDTMVALIPALKKPGEIGLVLCLVIHAVILLILSKEHKHYAFAAMFGLVNSIIYILGLILVNADIYVLFMLAVVQVVIMLIAEHYEYKAHADVVMLADANLSGQWDNCWRWILYSYIGFIVGLFLLFLLPFLGLIMSLAAAVGMLVAGIKKLVCLYRSAQVFRARAKQ
jgi:hypothetical protein